MTIRHINPDNVGKPAGPYSHMIETEDFVFMSGQAPIDPATGKLISGTFEEEATLVFNNIISNLNSLGLDLTDVVKVNAYLGDINYRTVFNDLYQRYFRAPFPARTTIACDLSTIKIEIEVIACKRK